MDLTKYLPERQQEGDYTVRDAMKLTGYKSTAAASEWLDSIPELKRIDSAVLLNGRKGCIWRPVKKGKE